MGLYDEIRWEAPLPEGHPADDRIFQTKSLHPCLEHFLVTAEGRLLLVGSGWQDEDLERAQSLRLESLRLQGVDVEFHGDMRLVSVKGHREYLARFTHGTLDWVKPLANDEPYDPVALARLKFAPSRSETRDGMPQSDALKDDQP